MLDWVEIAKLMAPRAPAANVEAIVPLLLVAMRERELDDEEMLLFAIATIRVETWAGNFLPTDEKPNKWSGSNFELYEPGTSAGRRLGNTQVGDGARFRGRGLIQLTGRDNYTRTGRDIGIALAEQPQRANEPEIAAKILASYIKQRERTIREAMWNEDYRAARKTVNAAALGLDEFIFAIERGYVPLEAEQGE